MTNPTRCFKDNLYEQFARIGKALSSPKRLELIDLLCQSPKTVERLAREANTSMANTSRHLSVLRGASLVETEKDGLYVTYRIADSSITEFYLEIRRLAEKRLGDVDRIARQFFEGKEDLEPVDREELIGRVLDGSVTVVDVRPVDEFKFLHIRGAISIPLKELESRLSELPPDREIVAYCRGPYCVFAVEAVEIMRANGYQAYRLEDGVNEWHSLGFESESERQN